MVGIIIAGINWIFTVAGIIGVVGAVFLIPGVIIAFVLYSKEKDEIKKKAIIKKGIIFSCLPFILIGVGLIGIVIIQSVKALSGLS